MLKQYPTAVGTQIQTMNMIQISDKEWNTKFDK